MTFIRRLMPSGRTRGTSAIASGAIHDPLEERRGEMAEARRTTVRDLLHASLAVAILLPAIDALPAGAQPACARRWSRDGLHLAGRLNGEELRGYLNTGHPAEAEDGVSGIFFYPDRWKPTDVGTRTVVNVDGTLAPDCAMQMQDPDSGAWRLHFATPERLEGTLERPDGRSTLSLRVVPATDCGAGGAWRTFRSPAWPITFDYPASWRLAEQDSSAVIACPSAEKLAWGGSAIWLTRGRGREAFVTDDGRSGTSIGLFATFGNGEWLVGQACDESDPGLLCGPARRSEWRGMTVLQGPAGEDRRYRAGGGAYLGQGAGTMAYLFLMRDAWVEIQSQDTPDSITAMGTAGPVIFDGDGVTERLVRSIRPK
jgi:hypothetical protein